MKFPKDLSPQIIEKALEMVIKPEDFEMQCVVGGGKGGQKINKTSSCVILKHVPTGIMVKCQKHREQSKNKLSAYKLVILKIEDQVKGKDSDRAKRIFKIRKQKQRRSRKAKEKMMDDKSYHSEVKKQRGKVDSES